MAIVVMRSVLPSCRIPGFPYFRSSVQRIRMDEAVSREKTTATAAEMLDRKDTVVKPPGLPSPCTMKCGEGLLTAFSVGFTPHIQRKTRTDLRLRPHPVDTLLHLAIAPVAPLHGIRGGGQQLVIQKRQSLFQGGGKELLELRAPLGAPQEPTSQCGQFVQRCLGPTAPIE